ncbi:hypothetical protein BC938DRAFT_472572 [Jimgerdemannia flammicorona]|uniref:DNA helicase Pif1-like 2B domain-containing protein n=1 Tax=Jimgerdemannia flammicorona TaxID=994334 RepID=A0A433QZW4_9FUNG|nr:hypothetical protein BC938DRAFT_472572 [Jimgerdemannia flammicorona]
MQEANCHQLQKLTGEAHRYFAIDSGDMTMVGKLCLFPQTLDIKVGAQVILLKNMTEKLVNGSAGIIKSFVKDQGESISYPSIHFDNRMIQTIWPEAWENEDRRIWTNPGQAYAAATRSGMGIVNTQITGNDH